VDYVLPADPGAPSRTHRHGNHLAVILSSTGPWSTGAVVIRCPVRLADTSHATNHERAPEIAEAIKRIIEQVCLTTSSTTSLTRSYPSDGVQ